jgi:hypothetical protein
LPCGKSATHNLLNFLFCKNIFIKTIAEPFSNGISFTLLKGLEPGTRSDYALCQLEQMQEQNQWQLLL